MHSTDKEKETAVLVAVSTQKQGTDKTKEYLDELAFLASTSGVMTLMSFTQNLTRPDNKTYVGKGKLEEIISNARLVDETHMDNSKVFILSKVLIKNQMNGMEIEYTLVAENEADIKLRKISIESPIGKGLLGKKVGDIAEIQTPGGIMNFEIISISR